MSKPFVPFAPFHLARSGRRMLHGFCPIGALLKQYFPKLDAELEESGNTLSATEYLAGAVLTSFFYFSMTFGLMLIFSLRISHETGRVAALGFGGIVAIAFFAYALLYPRLIVGRSSREIERNLLYATRHLMIQTSAGVPLFESIVSISENYGDDKLDYGAISVEFGKIAKEVRGGKELTRALEESAARINSNDYRRLLWQLSNANKAGANIGFVLKQTMSYLADEQRVRIRDYGSQLSPLAIFYMLMCIIAPTMGVIFLVIIATLAAINVTELLLGLMLLMVFVVQMLFIGLIKSRRPVMAV